jgi:hypothetical protein
VGLLLLFLYMGATGVMAQHDDDEPEVKCVFSVSIRHNVSFKTVSLRSHKYFAKTMNLG